MQESPWYSGIAWPNARKCPDSVKVYSIVKNAHRHHPRGLLFLAACALFLVMTGCTIVGPDAIRSGRLAYNEAITETNNQQMLMVLVHNRYEESNHLLSVSSVTANVSISSRAQIQAGFGDGDNYDGNLVPFSGGFIYEENPTISYTPVAGETYLRQLMSPIPLSLLSQVTHSLPYPEFAYNMLISSVNGIHNPAFLYGSQQDDPRFERFVTLMTTLTQQHSLYWAKEPGNAEKVSMVIEPSTAQMVSMSNDLLSLLGLPGKAAQGQALVIPAFPALHRAEKGAIGITTRTTWELVELMSAAVQVPAADEASGAASAFPRTGRAGRELSIAYANSRPERAYTAVEHGDGWFYIDGSDRATKRYFKLMGSLWSAAMAKSLGNTSSTPVLTVPVSR